MIKLAGRKCSRSWSRRWMEAVAGVVAGLVMVAGGDIQAGFTPLPLTLASFNEDIVVERTAPGPVPLATSASMDSGRTNTGYAWYESGYNATWPATGLPAEGSVVTSDVSADHQYRLAADYRTDNVVLVEGSGEEEIVLAAGGKYAGLSFLLGGMHDGGIGVLSYRVVHEDATEETGTVNCPDWMRKGYAAYTAQGRVDVRSFTFAQVNGGSPQLHTADIVLTNSTSAVSRIWLRHVSGVRTAVFAVSGASDTGTGFEPVTIGGYNADVVIEAGAMRPQWLTGVSTASMETGRQNGLRTWYEQGYAADGSGLPRAGSVFTNCAVADHRYAMAGAYDGNNAVMLDGDSPTAEMVLAGPAAVRAISFLTASVNGPTTNVCVVTHADGTVETNVFVSPDWMGGTSERAWSTGGRVDLNRRVVDCPAGGGPSLFGADAMLTNRESPVVKIEVTKGAAGTRTVIFAVSGESLSEPALLRIARRQDGGLRIESSAPGTLEYCEELAGVNTVWTDAGPISSARDVEAGAGARFWRVRK